ncbi:MAG: hypothetical protein ACRDOI_35490 [Trebonia sp.]
MSINSGVSITGNNSVGNISNNGGNVNTGSGPVTQAVQVSGDPRSIGTAERIDQLLAALLAGAGQLPPESAEVVTDEAEWLRQEMKRGELHPRHVRHALTALATAAAPVTSIMTAVNEVTDLVLKLLH